MKTQLRADMMLVLVTFCWGISYFLMDVSMTDMGPLTLNMYRFIGAFAAAGIFGYKKMRNISRSTLKYAILIGVMLFLVYNGATFGVRYTSLTNAGFLGALTVIFVPILELIIFRKTPGMRIFTAVAISFAGVMLLTLKDDFSFNMSNIRGDVLCILGALAYAGDLILTEKAVKHQDVDPFQLGVLQLGVTGVLMMIFSFTFETPGIPSSATVWISVIFLSLFCTGFAFIVQNIAQQYTTAAHVGIIYTLEPVFAGIAAFVFAGEILTAKAYMGAVLMISALVITEVNFGRKEVTGDEEETEEIIAKKSGA